MTTAWICLHPRSASLMPGGREAVPDPIGSLVKVDLVGCWSVKRVVRHFGVVLFDVEIERNHASASA